MKDKKSKFKIEQEPEFIVMNELCQVFVGFSSKGVVFSDDLDLAKPLYNDTQIDTLKMYTYHKLEKMYL
jgi:hypothetical protein